MVFHLTLTSVDAVIVLKLTIGIAMGGLLLRRFGLG